MRARHEAPPATVVVDGPPGPPGHPLTYSRVVCAAPRAMALAYAGSVAIALVSRISSADECDRA